MKNQYTKDKNCRLSFRVNEALYDWVAERAQILGVSPCDFARNVLFNQMSVEVTLRAIDAKPQNRCSDCEVKDENHKKHK